MASVRTACLPVYAIIAGILPTLIAQQLPIRTYTSTGGLPHNTIKCIVKDSRGFLWFCTSGGLSPVRRLSVHELHDQ